MRIMINRRTWEEDEPWEEQEVAWKEVACVVAIWEEDLAEEEVAAREEQARRGCQWLRCSRVWFSCP